MAAPKAVRHINEIRALEALFRNGPMSRADLARELDVTRATASSVVAALVKNNFLIERTSVKKTAPTHEKKPNKTGRPGTYICLNSNHAFFIGADIGVGRITISVINLTAEVVKTHSLFYDVSDTNASKISTLVADSVKETIETLGIKNSVNGLNIIVPGLVDLQGTVKRAPALSWKNIPLCEMVQSLLTEVEVKGLENDANAFAFADIQNNTASNTLEAVYLFLDAGLGGCIISDGNIHRGFHGYAGEIGHIVVGDQGYTTSHTIKGSLESYVTREAILNYHNSIGGAVKTFDDFLSLLKEKDNKALETLTNWSYYLGRGIAALTNILNPERIIIGGPISILVDHAYDELMQHIQDHLLDESNLPILECSKMSAEAPATGAALMMHKEFFAYNKTLLFGEKIQSI